MPRITSSELREVEDCNPAHKLQSFIRMSNILINQLHAADTGNLADDDTLKQLELLVAAHFYRSKHQRYTSKNTGRAGGTFQGQTAMVLMGTDPGQDACLLDPTGFLANRSKEAQDGQKNIAQFFWLGTPSDREFPRLTE